MLLIRDRSCGPQVTHNPKITICELYYTWELRPSCAKLNLQMTQFYLVQSNPQTKNKISWRPSSIRSFTSYHNAMFVPNPKIVRNYSCLQLSRRRRSSLLVPSRLLMLFLSYCPFVLVFVSIYMIISFELSIEPKKTNTILIFKHHESKILTCIVLFKKEKHFFQKKHY